MADCEKLTVSVSARLVVPDETAERCMRLLEMWLDDNAAARNIVCEYKDGSHRMRIVAWGDNDDAAGGG